MDEFYTYIKYTEYISELSSKLFKGEYKVNDKIKVKRGYGKICNTRPIKHVYHLKEKTSDIVEEVTVKDLIRELQNVSEQIIKTISLNTCIKQLRDSRRYSQQEMSDKLKISRLTYNQIESGIQQPSYKVLKKISEEFDTKLSLLVMFDE